MNYIITYTDNNYIPFLFDFVVSLFEIGNFTGKLIIFYYTNKENKIDLLGIFKSYDNIHIIVLDEKEDTFITNKLLLDINVFLKRIYNDSNVVIYDNDVWFQGNIENLFDNRVEDNIICSQEIPKPYKNLVKSIGGDIIPIENYSDQFISRFKNKDKYRDKLRKISRIYGTFINTGFLFSNRRKILNIIDRVKKEYLKDNTLYKSNGSDQLVFNYIIEENECITYNYFKYNYCVTPHNLIELKKGMNKKFYYSGIELVAIHSLYNFKFKESFRKQFQFRYLYPKIFYSKFNELNEDDKEMVLFNKTKEIDYFK
jgi:hypothetical protein